ncbi:MAG: Asp23/Gls24 family envelope stress response protein [Anaerovoracaceae bacterium]|jgi:uncharacterized alkaline shock family protein YloU
MDSFDQYHEENLGEIKISDDVMAVCAINATLRTPGVAELAGGFTDAVAERITGKEALSKGIKVDQREDGVYLDVYVVVEYGVKIPVVAWDIQTNVKKELETMTDRPVKEVNIHVQAVAETEDTEKTDEEEK